MNIEQIEKEIALWGEEKGLIGEKGDVRNQILKTMSELGELSDAILKDDLDEAFDGFGDVMITLINAYYQWLYENQNDIDMDDYIGMINPLSAAWHIVKNRTGRTVNGTFIKDE